jgi:thiol-disulfide isomerase/thioredoxin
MKNLILVSFLIILLSIELVLAEEEKGIQFEKGNWTEILSKAAKENKLVFLDAYASWCGPCKWMAKNVFTNDTAAEYYNKNFINAKIDMEIGEGMGIAKKYGVQAYPTFLYIDSNGELVHRTCGSCTTKDFIQNGMNALNPETQLITFKRKFEKEPANAVLASKYFEMMDAGCMKFDDEIEIYFRTQKESDLTSPGNWQIINRFLNDANSREFKYIVSNKKSFIKLYSDEKVNSKIKAVYESSLRNLIRSKDDNGYNALKAKVKKSGILKAEEIVLNSDLIYYQKNKDWKNYAKVAEKLINSYRKDDAILLNSVSWTIFENINDKAVLLKAEKWAKHSVELDSKYYNNDTYANVLFKLGKNKEAKAAAEKAIELAKTEGSDYKETEDLLKKIESELQ